MSKKSNRLAELNLIFKDNNISADTIEKNDDLIFEIKKRAATINDYRHQSYVQHLLVDVVMITFFAILSNANEWADIEVFAKEKENWLRKYLELPYGIPTDDTIRLIIGNIDSSRFYSLTITFLMNIIDKMLQAGGISQDQFEPDIIAVDGKVSVGSKRNKTDKAAVKALQTLNVFSTSYRMCVAQQFINEKTNEIPAAQELLKLMDLNGDIVTTDAMNCQKETVASIVKSKGDYVLAIKENQKQFYQDVKDYFDEEWFSECKKWANLKTFGMIKKTIKKNSGETEIECRYYICNIDADVELFARAARGHWGVENNLHWCLDFTFKDDKNTSMCKTGAKNIQIMKKIVLGVLGIVKESYKLSMAKIRYKLSLSYEKEIEKMFSMISVKSVEKALEKNR